LSARSTKTQAPGVAVVSNQQVSAGFLFKIYVLSNDGHGVLSLAHTYSLAEPGYAIATADFNGDGNLDPFVVHTDPSSQHWGYSVLLGNGDGSFQPPAFLAQDVTTQSYSLVVADFNGDRRPDIALSLGGLSGNQTFALLLGRGDGTFTAPSYIFDGGASSLLAADFNGDGKLDIVAGGTDGTAFLFGNGDGTFQPAIFPPTLSSFAAQFTLISTMMAFRTSSLGTP
jgi:hypothetical protein